MNPLLKVVSQSSSRNNKILDILLYRWIFIFAIKRKINTEIKDKHGNTPLIRAAARGNDYAVERLLQFGADSTATNKQGDTALKRAEKEHLTSTINILKHHDAPKKETSEHAE
jgi:hypothetical protein